MSPVGLLGESSKHFKVLTVTFEKKKISIVFISHAAEPVNLF